MLRMDKQLLPADPTDLHHPLSRRAFRTGRALAGCYLLLSALTLVAVVLLRADRAVVNPAVWVRGTIVVASALLTNALAARAARGSRGAYRRLRILCGVMVLAIVAIIAVPGTFPRWMKIEQAACGLLLLGVVAVANRRHVRAVFAAR